MDGSIRVNPENSHQVMLGLAVALLPMMELAGAQAQPGEQLLGWQLGAAAPVPHVVEHGVARVVWHPTAVQSSPLRFFSRTLASISSEMTSFFWVSLASS